MDTNFIALSRDWKQALGSKELIAALRKVEKAIGGEAQVREDMCERGDDAITACIFPANINREHLIKEDVVDVFGWTDEIHIDSDGNLWFHFKDFGYGLKYGLSTDKWLNEKDACAWVQGLGCAEEMVDGSVHKSELQDFLSVIERAKALV